MPVIQQSVSIAGNSTNDNVLQGSQYEFLPYDAFLEFGLSGSATGLAADVFSGQDVLAENMLLNAQNRVPTYPDDYNLNDVAGAGERIKVRIRNTTGGALTAFYSLKITPV